MAAEPTSLSALKDTLAIAAFVVSMISLSYTIYKGRIDQRVSVKPALIFAYDFANGWVVQNIGAGPAMNVVIACWDLSKGQDKGEWLEPIRIPPLKKDGIHPIVWAPHEKRDLGATYNDIWDRAYSTTCIQDLNVVRPGNQLRRWRKDEVVPVYKTTFEYHQVMEDIARNVREREEARLTVRATK